LLSPEAQEQDARGQVSLLYSSYPWRLSAPMLLMVDDVMHCGITLVAVAEPGQHDVYAGPGHWCKPARIL